MGPASTRQGVLHKADICRSIVGKKIDESNKKVLDEYEREDIKEIQFLSHSYFGENKNMLHFQHQSFAEILLAEYYLKVFVKYALDKKKNIEDVRAKLCLGEPTEQTILFFKELLNLLKETASNKKDKSTLEKRKLLLPLFASMATETNNTMYSSALDLTWFENVDITNDTSEYPKELLEPWAIKEDGVEKIVKLAQEIIDDKTTLLLSKSAQKTSLFDNELTQLVSKKLSELPTDIDRWLSLVVGNVLYTNTEVGSFFNRKLENPTNLLKMMKNWNFTTGKASPLWANKFFLGLNIKYEKEFKLNYLNMSRMDFSNSEFSNVDMSHCNLSFCTFDKCLFLNVSMASCDLVKSTFDDIDIVGSAFEIGHSRIFYGITFPIQIANILLNMSRTKEMSSYYVNVGAEKTYIGESKFPIAVTEIFKPLKGFMVFGIDKGFFTKKDLKKNFTSSSKEWKKSIDEYIDLL